MSSAPEHATIVIPTLARTDHIERLLRSLARQQDPGIPWDVIVVENRSSSDSKIDVLDSGHELQVPLRIEHEPELGSARARNRGISAARGTITVLIDDDVDPADDWLKRLLEPILAGRCSGAGGRIVLDPTVPRPSWFADWMAPYLTDFQPGAEERDVRDLAQTTLPHPYVVSANAAFRTDLLRAVGSFDTRLGLRGAVRIENEDLSLCRRFLEAGGTIRYVPGAVVVHELPPDRLTRRYLARRFYSQGRGEWLLDEDRHTAFRLRGARRVIGGFFRAWAKEIRAGGLPPKALRRIPYDAAYWLGFTREALAHLRRS
jgi:GT2 family glycosyltransferase